MKYKKIFFAFICIAVAGCAQSSSPEVGMMAQTAPTVDRAAILAAHNKWRAEVGVPELSYSAELESSALAWAENLKKTNHCQMRHSRSDGSYGENLYWASPIMWSAGRREQQNIAPEAAVDSWGAEKSNYTYATNACKPGKVCGHYTQVVWKGSQLVGCAYAVCEDSKEQVWVCQYRPAGNWVGEKPY
jgi:pathogenesis-related protein 1